MYVCICRAVTDSQIRQAANNGACSVKDLQRDLGVAVECGRCASSAKDCLRTAHIAISKADGRLVL